MNDQKRPKTSVFTRTVNLELSKTLAKISGKWKVFDAQNPKQSVQNAKSFQFYGQANKVPEDVQILAKNKEFQCI